MRCIRHVCKCQLCNTGREKPSRKVDRVDLWVGALVPIGYAIRTAWKVELPWGRKEVDSAGPMAAI